VKTAARLPLGADPIKLQADLAGIDRREWRTHFNSNYFDGDWTGVALRAPSEKDATLYADPTASTFVDTALMRVCPNLAAALNLLQCPLKSARLLSLSAGSSIREHRDSGLGWEEGEVRLHVPIITNSQVEFFLNGQRVVMQEGEYWYLDLGNLHRVENRGDQDRIHLVVDCVLNDWLRATIEAGEERVPARFEESEFDRFRRVVMGDSKLQGQLMGNMDRNQFISLMVGLGEQHGARFTPGDVDAALQAARREWIEQQI
jgi:hypothetical protein